MADVDTPSCRAASAIVPRNVPKGRDFTGPSDRALYRVDPMRPLPRDVCIQPFINLLFKE